MTWFGSKPASSRTEALVEKYMTRAMEAGWNGLCGVREQIERLVNAELALIEQEIHGALGLPPAFWTRREDELVEQLRASSIAVSSVHVSSPLAAAVLLPLALAGADVTVGAIVIVGVGVAVSLLAGLGCGAAIRRGWNRLRLAQVRRRYARALVRDEVAATWTTPRVSLILAAYDVEFQRASKARACGCTPVTPSN